MTLDELIAAERKAVDKLHHNPAKRQKLYAKMRRFSEKVQHGDLPDGQLCHMGTIALELRARDLAGASNPSGFFKPLPKRKKRL